MRSVENSINVESETLVEETEVAQVLRDFLALQARTATEGSRPLGRGVHLKGVCAKAVFEVLDVANGVDREMADRLASPAAANSAHPLEKRHTKCASG